MNHRRMIIVGLAAGTVLLVACGKKQPQAGPQAQKLAEPSPAHSDKRAGGDSRAVKPAHSQTPKAAAGPTQPLATGAMAPDFALTSYDGDEVSLAALRGKPVVLYFYPKDETPGCTVEAQDFRDSSAHLAKYDATVIGVSRDGLQSHKSFAENHKLDFPLVSDPEGELAAKYGVPDNGTYLGRVTFVIGRDGKIAKTFAHVQVSGHAEEVLAVLAKLRPSGG